MPSSRTGSAAARVSRGRHVLAIAVVGASVAIAFYAGVNRWLSPGGTGSEQIEQVDSGDERRPLRQLDSELSTGPAPTVAKPEGRGPRPRPGWQLPSPELIARLEAQGVPRYLAEQLQVERFPVLPDTAEYLGDSWNWLPELTRASSTLVTGGDDRPSMLQLYDISEDSVLREIGLEDGDVLVLLDEQILEFGRRDLFNHSRRMRAALESLERGEPVSVTILRGGRPLHLVYEP